MVESGSVSASDLVGDKLLPPWYLLCRGTVWAKDTGVGGMRIPRVLGKSFVTTFFDLT